MGKGLRSRWTLLALISVAPWRDRLADVGPGDDHAIQPRAEVAAVHGAGRASWQIGIDQPQHLLIGLFIRDVAGVPSRHSWLPPASPAVPRAGDQAPEAAGLQWDAWWDQALREERKGTTRTGLPTSPHGGPHRPSTPLTRRLSSRWSLPRTSSDAVRWSNDRNRERAGTKQGKVGELVETKLVRDMEAALGRTAQPFRPWVTEIPVDGQHFWQLGPEHVLLTADLLRDTAQ